MSRLLVIGCGALATELTTLKKIHGWLDIDVQCLDAALHNRPERIAVQLEAQLTRLHALYDHIFIAYADCGSRGAVDAVAKRFGAERLPGAHCYEFYAGTPLFQRLAEAEPGTFYLTDFLVRHFDRLVIKDLKLESHPELQAMLFGNYRKVVYLAQIDDATLRFQAEAAAETLELPLEIVHTGYGLLGAALEEQVVRIVPSGSANNEVQ